MLMVKGSTRSMKIQAKAIVRVSLIIVSPATFVKSARFFNLKIFDEEIDVLDGVVMKFYAKFGILCRAQYVFDRIPERNIVFWNCLITENVRSTRKKNARKVFDTMPKRDMVSRTTIMNNFCHYTRLLYSVLDEMFNSQMQYGYSLSPQVVSTLFHIVLNLYPPLPTELKLQLEAKVEFDPSGFFIRSIESLTHSQSDNGEHRCSDSWALSRSRLMKNLTSCSFDMDIMDDSLEIRQLATLCEAKSKTFVVKSEFVACQTKNTESLFRTELKIASQHVTVLQDKLEKIGDEKAELKNVFMVSTQSVEVTVNKLLELLEYQLVGMEVKTHILSKKVCMLKSCIEIGNGVYFPKLLDLQWWCQAFCRGMALSYHINILRKSLHIMDSSVTIGSGSIIWTPGVALLEAVKTFMHETLDNKQQQLCESKASLALLFSNNNFGQ